MSKKKKIISLISTPPEVEIFLPDGRVLSGPRGRSVEEFLKSLPEWNEEPIVGAIVNSELRELTYPIEMESRVKPLTMDEADGARIYRRSVTFLLEAAFDELYPDEYLKVDYSVPTGGYYCEVIGRPPLAKIELKNLEKRMRELVKSDLPFQRQQVPLEEAIDYFKKKNQNDKTRLLKFRQKGFLVLYRLGDHRDYHHGYMVPSTRYLKWFDLIPMGKGLVLRFPRRHNPAVLQPMPESKSLLATFNQYGGWLTRMGIESVGALDEAIVDGRIREIILVSEALHEQKIADIASTIVEDLNRARIVLIAGPSSSGKTTFSKRLAIQLLAMGVEPFALELDNYFVNRENTPRDENGNYDFEALEALDTRLLGDHIRRMINGEEVQIPHYNFKSGRSEPGEIVHLTKDQLLVLEGIHGLNPKLLPEIPIQQTFRLYSSCLTQINLDRHNRVSTTDTRLLRRIVRDARERGYSAQQTIQRWNSVLLGERKHIFPYQENANEMFNSALVYELSALKPLAEPLLRQVSYGTPEHIEAKRLLAFLEWFLPLEIDLIPDNSILREFVGGSILKDFKLWKSS
jgi:uridine kinase